MPAMKPGVVHRKKGAPVTLDVIRARSDEIGDCWIWKGATTHGSPAISINGRAMPTRRWLAETIQGKNTKGYYASVSCGELLCVNPEHVLLAKRGTINRMAAERTGYGKSLARSAKLAEARRRKYAKLSSELVAEIRASSLPVAELARLHGVAKSTIANAISGKTWRDYANNPWNQLLRLAA
jgi:hypothetical protein